MDTRHQPSWVGGGDGGDGWGGSNLHSKSPQTQVEASEGGGGAAVESVLIGSHLSSARTES